MRTLVIVGAALALAACGNDKPGVPAEAAKIAGAISGDDKGAAADNSPCALFTAAEVSGFAGEPVGETRNAAGGLGCQWMASDGSGSAIVTVTEPGNHVVTDGAPGFKALPNIGKDGFVAGAAGSWSAGAVSGDKAVEVSVTSDKATESGTVTLLEAALAKVKA